MLGERHARSAHFSEAPTGLSQSLDKPVGIESLRKIRQDCKNEGYEHVHIFLFYKTALCRLSFTLLS